MAVLFRANRKNLPAGRTESPVLTIPAGTNAVKLTVDSVTWADSSLVIELDIMRSIDGGQTFVDWSDTTIIGGTLARDGSLPSTTIDCSAYPDGLLAKASVVLNNPASLGFLVETV